MSSRDSYDKNKPLAELKVTHLALQQFNTLRLLFRKSMEQSKTDHKPSKILLKNCHTI